MSMVACLMAAVFVLLSLIANARAESHSQPLTSSDMTNGGDGHQTIMSSRMTKEVAAQLCNPIPGQWCMDYQLQVPVPHKPPPRGSLTCVNKCNNVGTCNHDTGHCSCSAGWTGSACEIPDKLPCTAHMRRTKEDPVQSHIDPITKEDLDWKAHGYTASRCAGVCDDDVAMCYCGQGSKYRRIPAPPGSPPGTPPVRQGRPLNDLMKPRTDGKGNALTWGTVDYDDLYGPSGWCNADTQNDLKMSVKAQEMGALHDCGRAGLAGLMCNVPHEVFCPNQCTGHGTCLHGFCKCDEGWYGTDCTRKMAGLPAYTEEDRAQRARREHLLNNVVTTPRAALHHTEVPIRKRPFIYVYDLLPDFNTRLLQYANQGTSCVWRSYNVMNQSSYVRHSVYFVETALHEMMLGSRHRTFDPEEADFFYVPIYLTCYAWPVLGWGDGPWYQQPATSPNRAREMSHMMLSAKQYIQAAFPWWDRKQGRDHIWLTSVDEGACYMPSEIYNTSIIFTHWGRMGLDHTSNTAFHMDNYSERLYVRSGGGRYEDWRSIYEGHACFDPQKDLVIPAFVPPTHYAASPFFGGKEMKRDILLYFRGDVGQYREPWYSRGIRQKLYNLSKGGWKEKYNIWIGDRNDLAGDYSNHLSRSKFCLVVPGDGYALRIEDSIPHGCIPFIIMDGVQAVFESILDYSAFSVRIKEADIDHSAEILSSISDQHLASLQQNLRDAWSRFIYLGSKMTRETYTKIYKSNLKANAKPHQRSALGDGSRGSVARLRYKDAFSTIMAWLYGRANATRQNAP